jgi:hypothetical protein
MHIYKYADFIFTCPLLVFKAQHLITLDNPGSNVLVLQTIDLIGTLNLPVNSILFLFLHAHAL